MVVVNNAKCANKAIITAPCIVSIQPSLRKYSCKPDLLRCLLQLLQYVCSRDIGCCSDGFAYTLYLPLPYLHNNYYWFLWNLLITCIIMLSLIVPWLANRHLITPPTTTLFMLGQVAVQPWKDEWQAGAQNNPCVFTLLYTSNDFFIWALSPHLHDVPTSSNVA